MVSSRTWQGWPRSPESSYGRRPRGGAREGARKILGRVLGERILGHALARLSNKQILKGLDAEVPGHGINRANLSTWQKARSKPCVPPAPARRRLARSSTE